MRSKKLWIVIGSVIGVVVVIFAVYFLRSLSRPGEATAQYIPSRAPAYFSINLRPGVGQLNQARNVLSKLETEALREQRDDLLEEIEDNTRIHFLDDVTPWLGTDISIAILDADPDALEWIVLIQSSDRDAAVDFVDDLIEYLEDEFGMEFDEDEDNGVDLWVALDDPLAMGVTDEYVLLGDSEDSIEDIADNIESPPSRSLMDNESFIAAREMLPSERFVFAFAQTDDLIDTYLDVLDPFGDVDSTMRQLEENIPDFIAASSTFIENGVRLDLSYQTPKGAYLVLDDATRVESHEVLPVDTLAMVSMVGLHELWDGILDSIDDADPYAADAFYESLDSLEDELGIDLERDVIDALSGEVAVALLPSDVGSGLFLEEGTFDWTIEALLLAGVVDGRSIENVLEDLVDEMEDFDLDVRRKSLGDYKAVMLQFDQDTFMQTDYDPGYVVTDEWMVVGSTSKSLEMFHDTLVRDSESLSDNGEFQRMLGTVSYPPQFLLYADIRGVLDMAEDALTGEMRSSYRREVEPYVENLSAFMVISSANSEESRATAVLTVEE